MYFGRLQYRPSRARNNQQSGYMLIVVVFLMVLLIISALVTTATITEQIKRDREEEMIHRGVQYTRAIKRYYRKFGRYPPTIEALEDTNNMRFLRKRYKDPFSKDGSWVVVKYGQVRFGLQGGTGFNNSGQPGLPNVPGVTGMFQNQGTGGLGQTDQSSMGQNQQQNPQQQTGQNQQQNPQQQTGQNADVANTGDLGANGTTGGDNTSGNTGAPGVAIPAGTTGTNSTSGGLGAIGGGAVIGVASSSDKESLRVIADKNHYKDWRFVYDPTFDRGALITGPYDPKKAMGVAANGSNIGQQLGQPIGQQPGTDSNNSFGVQGNFGQQPQQPSQPIQQNQQ